jgi:hypothetical protein
MKHGLACLLLTPLLIPASALASVATSSASLVLDGVITPGAACDMTLGNGVIDLGRLSRADLNQDPSKPTVLGDRQVEMRIDCPDPRRYAVVATAGTPTAGDEFDFGLSSEGDNSSVGSLYVLFERSWANIEGADAYYTAADTAGDLATAQWGPSSRHVMPIPNGTFAVGFVTTEGSYAAPSPIRNFDIRLLVRPKIRPVNELNLTSEMTFTGSLAFEIRYF